MNLERIPILLTLAAIPAWYTYRTATDKIDRRLQWSQVLKTEAQKAEEALDERHAGYERHRLAEEERRQDTERRVAEEARVTEQRKLDAQFRTCVAVVREVESIYPALIAEQKRYRELTHDLLKSNVPGHDHWDKFRFRATFEMLYREPVPEGTLAEQLGSVQVLGHRCSDSIGKKTDEDVAQILTKVQAVRSSFKSRLQGLNSSRRDIAGLIKFYKGELPETLEGNLEASRTWELIYRATTR